MSEQDRESGNDELMRERGVLDTVERQRAEELELERYEEQRTADSPPVDDGVESNALDDEP